MSQADAMLLMVVGSGHVELGSADGAGGVVRLARVEIDAAEPPQAGAAAAIAQAVRAVQPAARALRVLVSDRWVSLSTLPWTDELTRRHTADAVVRRALQDEGCDVGVGDVVRAEDGPYRTPYLAVLYPAALLAALRAAAVALGVPLQSVLPLSLAAVEVAQAQRPPELQALAVLEGSTASFLRVTGSRAMVLQVVQGAQLAGLDLLWRRVAARHAVLSGGPGLHVFDLTGQQAQAGRAAELPGIAVLPLPLTGDAPAALRLAALTIGLQHRLDALRAVSPWRRWSTVAALAAAGVCMGAAYVAATAVADLRAQQAHAGAAAAVLVPAAVARGWTPDELGRVKAVNAAINELNMPVGSLLSELKPPRDIAVLLLGVEVQPVGAAQGSGSKLKVSAEGGSAYDMARYLAFLASRPAFASAYLVHHEAQQQDGAAHYRFTIDVEGRE